MNVTSCIVRTLPSMGDPVVAERAPITASTMRSRTRPMTEALEEFPLVGGPSAEGPALFRPPNAQPDTAVARGRYRFRLKGAVSPSSA